jgi:hypothetical protein
MKRIKWTIMTFAILLSIGGAFASRPHHFQGSLYYWNGSSYQPAGKLGVNYVCESSASVCTYTFSNGVYTPYMTLSSYIPTTLTTTKPAPEKNK